MVYPIDYYTYEYGVLRGLTDVFNEITVTISSDTYKAYRKIRNDLGKLENKVISQWDGARHLTLNLTKDFHVGINEDIIHDAYNNNIPIEITTQHVADKIKTEWLKIICK